MYNNLKSSVKILFEMNLKKHRLPTRGGSRMISEGVQFDQIFLLTLCIRAYRPWQTV